MTKIRITTEWSAPTLPQLAVIWVSPVLMELKRLLEKWVLFWLAISTPFTETSWEPRTEEKAAAGYSGTRRYHARA